MHTRTRTLRFTAVLAFVVLGLTGFSTGRHGGHHGSGGGGCGSSHQDHDTSTSGYTSGSTSGSTSGGGSYDDPDDHSYASTGTTGGSHYGRRPTHRATATPSGGGARPLRDGTVRLISCATPNRRYATVEIGNPNDRDAKFRTRVTFYDDEGAEILDSASSYVKVPAKGRATTRVAVGERVARQVHRCEADRVARPDTT
ncbi:hypothetical protein [Streptomyces sp. NPDC051452]|uniref:hypothetical protein n=1 Tax=Streptomyces sp. NPDC051452 TaxID=3365654 RepID=UPI0037998F2C